MYDPTTTSTEESTKELSILGCDDELKEIKCTDDTIVKIENDSNGNNSSQLDTDDKVKTAENSDIIKIVEIPNGHVNDTNIEVNVLKDDDIHQQDLNGHFIDDETDASDIIFQAQIIFNYCCLLY